MSSKGSGAKDLWWPENEGGTSASPAHRRGIGDGVLATPVVLPKGDIELDCAATNTGSESWDMVYVALDDDATVAAS